MIQYIRRADTLSEISKRGEYMKKKTALVLCFALALLLSLPIYGASYREISVYINGEKLITSDYPRLINDTTYVPLRAICELFGAESISWEQKTKTATVKARGTSIYIKEGDNYIIANGRYFACDEKVLNIDDRLYIPVRLISSAFASEVEWRSDYSVRITDKGSAPTSGAEYYDEGEVYWLSRIIYAESGAEPFLGKIAVGNVVLNRVKSDIFPNTIYEVIFDKKHGTQFAPTSSGSIYNTPNADSVAAAKICLEGYSVDESVLYFMEPRLATNTWISQNRRFAFQIGAHHFYY